MKNEKTAVVILAAGNSSRMQRLKALLPFDEHTVFLEKIISVYQTWGCREIIIVVNQQLEKEISRLSHFSKSIKIVLNKYPERERFYSVKLGLAAIKESEYSFLQNIDNPCIAEGLLDLIYQVRSENHYVKPVYRDKGGHPILLNKNNISYLLNYQNDNAILKDVLFELSCKKAEMPDHSILININTPEAYESLTRFNYS